MRSAPGNHCVTYSGDEPTWEANQPAPNANSTHQHMAAPKGPPVVLTHTTCGCETTPTLTCSCCGEELKAREMRPSPGPGAVPAG